jgi:trimethylamine monooxygenase
MYRYLWSNGPKECLEFADYTFEEHFGKAIASYPPRGVLADYIKGRVEKDDVRKFCKFNHTVNNISYSEDTGMFAVAVRNLLSKTNSTEEFDYVVVATGHFSTPNVPDFEGFDTFNGRVLHAHDFRDAVEFKDKDILIVGTSYSAEDIASQCYKYRCKSVTISHRTAPTGFHWPDAFEEVPLLTHVENSTAHFKDEKSRHIDSIILCTGYLHHFPFIDPSLRLEASNRLWPLDLYQGVVWEDNPKLMYLGMQDQFYTFNMFDAQAWYARDVIMCRLSLPSLDEMRADSGKWRAREESLKDDKEMIWFQGDYVKALIDQTDYPSFDIEGINKTFMEWEHHKHENIMTFRNNAHKSVMTGNMQPVHHTPWLEAMDDSIESYLKTGSTNDD